MALNLNNQQVAKCILSSNTNLVVPTNGNDGGIYTLIIAQPSDTPFAMTYDASFNITWPDGIEVQLEQVAEASLVLQLLKDGDIWRCLNVVKSNK